MRDWIPISTSPKGRLVLAAISAFGSLPYEAVTVGGLSTEAKVTTGALYHHFGSKLGLYDFVRTDIERRLLDRMEGAIAASEDKVDRSASIRVALLIGFDFAVQEGFLHILGTRPAGGENDPLAEMLGKAAAFASPALGPVLAAAWRAALLAVADGAEPQHARSALLALEIREPS